MKHLILFHGWGASGTIWERQVRAFEKKFSVLAPTIARWESEWVTNYLKNNYLRETVAVGWSLGGMLLIESLAESGLRPACLLLVAVPAAFCQREDHPWGQLPTMVRAMRRALKQDSRKVLEDFALRCLAPGEESFREEVTGLFRSDMAEDHLAAGLDYLLNADLRPQLSRVSATATIIQGDQDHIVAADQARFMTQHLPGSRLVVIPGAGHLPFVTRAAEFNEIVREVMGGGPGK